MRFGRQARSVILNAEQQPVRSASFYGHHDHARRPLGGMVDEVSQNFLQILGTARDQRIEIRPVRLDRHLSIVVQEARRRHNPFDDRSGLRGVLASDARRGRTGAGELIVDLPTDRIALFLDYGPALSGFGHALGFDLEMRKGGLESMRPGCPPAIGRD